MRSNINWRAFWILAAGLIATALLAATQSYVSHGADWASVGSYGPAFLSFMIPVLLAFALIAVTNRQWLPGEQGTAARKYAWAALILRLSFLVIVPVAMLSWGYPTDSKLNGMVEVDASNASNTAWIQSTANTPLLSTWGVGKGDNTGGLTVIGVAMYRLFSPDLQRSLLLGILAAAVTSLMVAVTFRLADQLFNAKIARWAALLVAVYPEAILIGTGHQQQGYTALLLGVELLAIVYLMQNRPPTETAYPAAGRKTAWLLLAGSLALMVFLSNPSILAACLCGVLLAMWLSSPRKMPGKILWGGALIVGLLLAALRLLDALDIISGRMDPLMLGHQYLTGYAWTEFDKMMASGGGDMFQKIYLTMERPVAFVVAGFYGLLQPVLPAAIGYRNATGGGGFWTVLGILRGAGWYAILPIVLYATVSSFRSLLRRRIESYLAIVFWVVAFISSYRALGDLWDNPRYRLLTLVPLAVLTAWGWVRARESGDPWFIRIVIPFAVLVVGLTVWYFIRGAVPLIPALGALGGITALAFILTLVLIRHKNPPPTG
jgi:hypothetical protein